MQRIYRWKKAAAYLCAVACVATVPLSLAPSAIFECTEDRNGDGQPDVWHHYDARGSVIRVAIDSNFDGRSDRHEKYVDGTLIQRQSDRNFDDRIDLVENFDGITHQHIRSVIDVGFDGSADLLVLFQDGRPVFSKWELPRNVVGDADGFKSDSKGASKVFSWQLASLADPFGGELAVRSRARSTLDESVFGAVSTFAMPLRSTELAGLAPSASILKSQAVPHKPLDVLSSSSLRGPPAFDL